MEFRVENVPVSLEWTVKLGLEGKLDSNSARDFEKKVEEVLAGYVEILILDFSKLSYISSAGIRVLITANNKMAERDGRVIVAGMQPQIAKVMEIIRDLPRLNMFGSEQELDEYLLGIQEKIIREKQKPSEG